MNSGVCCDDDDDDTGQIVDRIDLDDPVYIEEKERRSSILSQNMDKNPFTFKIEDWKREDPNEHNFQKLILKIKYMCT